MGLSVRLDANDGLGRRPQSFLQLIDGMKLHRDYLGSLWRESLQVAHYVSAAICAAGSSITLHQHAAPLFVAADLPKSSESERSA
jgi:hypothetical protein